MKHGELPPGWKVTELLPDDYRVLRHVKEAREIAKALAAMPREKRKVPTHFNGKSILELNSSEKEEFLLSMQEPSTKAALIAQKSRKLEDDEEHFLRPLPLEADWKRDYEAKRDVSIDEFSLYKSMQRTSKNTLGQSTKSSAEGETRDRAIHAFTYSKPHVPTDGELKRIQKLEEMGAIIPDSVTSTEALETPPHRSLWRRLLDYWREPVDFN